MGLFTYSTIIGGSTRTRRDGRREITGGMAVSVDLDEVAGRLEVVGLRTDTPGRPLTSAVLRTVKVGELRTAAIAAYRATLGADAGPAPLNAADLDDEWQERRAAYWRQVEAARDRPVEGAVRVRLTPEQLADVADLYRQAVAEHQPPLRVIEATYGVSRGVVCRWVTNARKAGLLAQSVGRGRTQA